MSQDYCILNLLNIEDKNIKLTENFYKIENFGNIQYKVIEAILSYEPIFCHRCGCTFNKEQTYEKNGFKTSDILMLDVCNHGCILRLKKQRFLCHSCNKKFFARTKIVNDGCFISNQVKYAIALELKNKISEVDIAKRYRVSPNTVERIIDSYYDTQKLYKHYLPEVLSFDEFKSVKSAEGAMSFHMCDGKTGKTIDIVENRKLNSLMQYFSYFTHKARCKVKLIVIDMYSPYITLIEELFPKANISIDRFHLVQLINRSFNKSRINIMNKFHKKYPSIYNKLKKYWKLLLKDSSKLSYIRKYYHHSFRQYISEEEIVTRLLLFSKELEEAYTIYQNLIFFIKTRNYIAFQRFIKSNLKISSHYMLTSIKTYIKYLPYIKNSLNYPFSNGPIEGINNKIKVIKRIAFGYRSFYHLRNRILIYSNLTKIKIPSA